MAGNKYLANSSGRPAEVAALQTSAGAGDAGKIPGLDSTGRLDATMMPVGIAADTVVCATSENIAAGSWVNLYLNAGVLTARKADATTNGKRAHGFVLAATLSGANATVYLEGQNTQVSGRTIGAMQWLDTTAGGGTETAPSTSGNLVQQLGIAMSATAVPMQLQEVATIA